MKSRPFSERLREIRTRRAISHPELALLCGIARTTISRYESGDFDEGITDARVRRNVERLAEALDVPVDDLVPEAAHWLPRNAITPTASGARRRRDLAVA